MMRLACDLETYSPEPLPKTGVHRYAEHPEFEILLFGYSVDGGPVGVIDLAGGEPIPPALVDALFDPGVVKHAFNAAFEIACLSAHFRKPLPAEQWRCTSVLALTLGMPGNLATVAEVCKLPVDKRKMGIGGAMIRYFCMPCKPTKANGGRTRNLPTHDPARWGLFKEYCARDVVTEMAVFDKLSRWAPSTAEQNLWVLDQHINAQGWGVDTALVQAAIAIDDEMKAKATAEFIALTGISKATQVAKLKTWLAEEHDIETESLDKEAVKGILKLNTVADVERALTLRQELSKSSVAKYTAMSRSACADGRIRGLFQFYGANRTGRWAGRIVQAHNLPRSDLSYRDLALARDTVKSLDTEMLHLLYGDMAGLLSQLLRSAFVAHPGKVFVVVDFAAIEARVLAWSAAEEWRLEVFRTHGRIYEASAAEMFKVPIESIGKKSPLRQKGKISELALGYHGGVGALIAMGALKMGLKEEDLQPLVDAWRTANPNIMSFGRQLENHAKQCLRTRIPTGDGERYGFRYESGMLFLDLPSGRSLCYVKPRIEKSEITGYWNISYDGQDPVTKQWGRTMTYAGKLLENHTQATARDCLAVALTRLSSAGFQIVGHVHDEVICEVEESSAAEALARVEDIFAKPIGWAPGLPLKGDGFISHFYRKDA